MISLVNNPDAVPRQLALAEMPTATEIERRKQFLSSRNTPSGRTFREVFESCGVGFDRDGRPVTRTHNRR